MIDSAEPNVVTGRSCRICGGDVEQFFDFGRQPVSDSFVTPETAGSEFFYRLVVGHCRSCTMVQQLEEVPREQMFHEDYPYRSSGSSLMRAHFEGIANHLLRTELTGPNPFVVEIGSNDGIMLRTLAKAGIRHLGVDPSAGVAELARAESIRVRTAFFEYATAADIAATDGRADVIFSANTLSHIPYLDSIFRGVDELLTPDGVFVFEDRTAGDIIGSVAFDQIYDEHFYLFSATSVATMVRTYGFELVDVEPLTVHGGAMRFTVARSGARIIRPSVAEHTERERAQGLADPATYRHFADQVRRTRTELMTLLRDLAAQGHSVVGYGATAKSATVINYCGIGPDLVRCVYDSTPAKQGRLTPGTHIPVRPAEEFAVDRPDYALLFAWNHAEEIMAKEAGFRAAGGHWIRYVPGVRID
jgi:methylation protein EvaC